MLTEKNPAIYFATDFMQSLIFFNYNLRVVMQYVNLSAFAFVSFSFGELTGRFFHGRNNWHLTFASKYDLLLYQRNSDVELS